MQADEPPLSWPLVRACVAEHKPALNLSKLSREDKRSAWAAIQKDRPALGKLLQEPAFTDLVDRFNGEVIVDLEQLLESAHHLRK